MSKLILMSVLVATVVIPVRAAREARPALAVKKVVVYGLLFHLAYLFAVLVIYPRIQ